MTETSGNPKMTVHERITKAWSDPAGIFFKVEEVKS